MAKRKRLLPFLQRSLNQQLGLALILMVVLLAVVVGFGEVYYLLSGLCEGGSGKDCRTPSWFGCVYFSVVTVATLGYGDISPTGSCRLVACIEVVVGLFFFGYAVAQLVSARQEKLIDYLATDRIIQTYDECLAKISDARELIADRRRAIQANLPVDASDFVYNRSNPFYPALRAMEMLNAYTAHVEGIGRAQALAERVARAAHHVEELAGFARKYLNLLNNKKIPWRQGRTIKIVAAICDTIDLFATSHLIHTRYAKERYKDGGMYVDIVGNLTRDIRRKLQTSV